MTHHNFAHELPRLSGPALDAQPPGVPHYLALLVHPDQGHWVHKGEEDRGEAHASHLAVDVQHVGVALRRPVELADELDPEPLLELLPDAGPQAIAPHDLDTVTPVLGSLGRREKVPAYLPNVLRTLVTE